LVGHVRAPLAEPPDLRARYLALGLGLGTLFVTLGLASPGRPALRVTLGVGYVVVGGLGGLLGCALCYLTFFSAHSAALANYNVLLLPPWLLALASAGVGVLRGQPRAWQTASWAAHGAALSAALALGLHVLLQSAQSDAQELALTLPLWLGVARSARQPRWLLGKAGKEQCALGREID
jgi:hypothetical protein